MKKKENFDEFINERYDEIQNLSKQINYADITYYFKGKERSPKYFSNFQFSLKFFKEIRDGEITMKKAKENQKEFKSDLNSIARAKYKSQKQESTM